jgi:V8-like Glu-specific endopeptidase
VLTAAHVVYRATDGGAAINVVVTPGLDGTRTPFGAFEVYGGFFFTGFDLDRNDLLTNADSAQDAAVLSFDTDIGSTTGWMGHATPDLVGGTANLTGYPAKTLTARLESYGAGSRLRLGWTRRWSIRRIAATVTVASETSGSAS